jgi:hypothetical protein
MGESRSRSFTSLNVVKLQLAEIFVCSIVHTLEIPEEWCEAGWYP